MNFIEKKKKILSLLFLLLFITPTIIKSTHYLYVHHHHVSLNIEKQYTTHYNKCPVCNYQIAEYLAKKIFKTLPNINYAVELIKIGDEISNKKNFVLSVLLRGPPLFII